MNLERQLIQLIATDRIDKPISSMSGKLKRAKPKLARAIDLSGHEQDFEGDRVWAYVEEADVQKARGMREGIKAFSTCYPEQGAILNDLIQEKRILREQHLYFGMHKGKRLTSSDYLGVMTGLGFSERTAEGLYPELMSISYRLAQKRGEQERRVLIG